MQRPREVLEYFAAGGAGVVCWLPLVRETRFSPPARSLFVSCGVADIVCSVVGATKIATTALFSSRTVQELQCVQGFT